MRGFRALNIVSAAQVPLMCISEAQGRTVQPLTLTVIRVNYQAMYNTTPSAQRVAPRPEAGTASYEHHLRT